jgi:hypothetical protein
MTLELERWLSGKEPRLFFRRIKVWFPASTEQLTTMCNSGCRESDTLFWPLWVSSIHVVHRHTCRQNTHTYKISTSLKKKQKTKTKQKNWASKMTYIYCDYRKPLTNGAVIFIGQYCGVEGLGGNHRENHLKYFYSLFTEPNRCLAF